MAYSKPINMTVDNAAALAADNAIYHNKVNGYAQHQLRLLRAQLVRRKAVQAAMLVYISQLQVFAP